MYVKLCGLRTGEQVEVAVTAGADAVGFVFADSVRRIEPAAARDLVREVPPSVLTVGVFAGMAPAEVRRVALESGVGAIQLHGDYDKRDFADLADTGLRLLRAVALTPGTDVAVGAFGEDMLLLDSPDAGSGRRWDLSTLTARPEGHWLLAGGLGPDNVAEAIAEARPWGVDVSSGIESSRGVKDLGRMRAFVAAARSA